MLKLQRLRRLVVVFGLFYFFLGQNNNKINIGRKVIFDKQKVTIEYIVLVKKQLLLWLLLSPSTPWCLWCICRVTNRPLPFINFERYFHWPQHYVVTTFTNNKIISFFKLFLFFFSLERTDDCTQKSVYVASFLFIFSSENICSG